MAASADNQISLIRETIPGTTPSSPAFKTFDNIGGAELTFDGSLVTSAVLLNNREVASAAYVNFAGGGGLKTQVRRDTSTEMLIEGVLGGAFVSNVAKGGNTDFSHTVEKKMIHNGTAFYHRYTGMYVTKLSLNIEPGSAPEYAFEFSGMNKTPSATAIASATYAAPTQGAAIYSKDVSAISIGGLSASFTSLQMTIDQPREPQFVIGSASAGAVNASNQPRVSKVTATLLRTGIDVDALANTVIPVSFAAGVGTGNVHTWAFPKMICSFPADNSGGSSLLVTVELTAVNDTTLNSGVSCTRS